MPRALPVILVAPVTAAVTEGPVPPMVIDVALTLSTRPVSSTRSWPFPLPDSPGGVGRLAPFPEKAGADALGVAPSAALAVGVPLIRRPTTTPAVAATTATAAATHPE